MAERDEIEALAGEYVLGTLDRDERRAAEARLAADPPFKTAVAGWERRLQPLADMAPDVAAPSGAFNRVMATIDGAPAAPVGSNVVTLRRTVRRWQFTTALMGAAAAVLAVVVVLDRTAPPPQSEFVAVLAAEGAKPALIATVNTAKGTITVRPVALQAAPADKSYELWSIEPNEAPKSLGLVEQASLPLKVKPTGKATFAISLEPKGGSKTGAPTGPVMFTGALVATE